LPNKNDAECGNHITGTPNAADSGIRHYALQRDEMWSGGKFPIDLPGRVELAPRQGFVVPKTVMHRTRAAERTVVLMVENAGIVPTGN